MSGIATAVVGTALIAKSASDKASEAAQETAAESGVRTEEQYTKDRALSMKRFREAERGLSPYITSSKSALHEQEKQIFKEGYVPGRDDVQRLGKFKTLTPEQYIKKSGRGFEKFVANNPAFQSAMDYGLEAVQSAGYATGRPTGNIITSLRDAGQGITESFYNNYMSNYTGFMDFNEQQRINEQNVQEQRYTNYMNTLTGMASPATATNLASMGMNQGTSIGQAGAASVANQNQYAMTGTAAANAAQADFYGGITQLGGAYIMRPQSQPPNYDPYFMNQAGGYGPQMTSNTIA